MESTTQAALHLLPRAPVGVKGMNLQVWTALEEAGLAQVKESGEVPRGWVPLPPPCALAEAGVSNSPSSQSWRAMTLDRSPTHTSKPGQILQALGQLGSLLGSLGPLATLSPKPKPRKDTGPVGRAEQSRGV
ncbi:Hypothetical predicted protein [Marmota monax]|uniref:Uncharacterized protein n=1 Tax=Marmota monax TaxID=9995 RepID=A0A5E4APG5_MARMO|nr:hypothetical protein GHT09_013268 [Marmota monax]VTJ59238.1 Hypothetical predicted protein [Marmota monax]